jgi:hypothetical protein
MRSRKVIAAAGFGMLALGAFGAFVLWPQPGRITEQDPNRIKGVSTRSEVVAVLGPLHAEDLQGAPLRTGERMEPLHRQIVRESPSFAQGVGARAASC